MKYVLIDANIYLDFYRFSPDDLTELEKLVELGKTGELVVYSCQQVADEITRNRGKAIAEALDQFKRSLPGRYPQLVRSYPRFSKLVEAQKAFAAEHSKICDLVTEDAAKLNLPADHVIGALLKNAEQMQLDSTVIESARHRSMRGNPPGKGGSYGDALIWEALMSHHSNRVGDVHLVSGDNDFSSDLQRDDLHEILVQEVADRLSGGEVILHKRLGSFLQIHYPDIEVAAEAEADVAVSQLERSGSFSGTHSAIARLENFSDFSPAHANRLARAAIENDQVGMIVRDADVEHFYRRLLDRHGEDMDAALRNSLTSMVAGFEYVDAEEPW